MLLLNVFKGPRLARGTCSHAADSPLPSRQKAQEPAIIINKMEKITLSHWQQQPYIVPNL